MLNGRNLEEIKRKGNGPPRLLLYRGQAIPFTCCKDGNWKTSVSPPKTRELDVRVMSRKRGEGWVA